MSKKKQGLLTPNIPAMGSWALEAREKSWNEYPIM